MKALYIQQHGDISSLKVSDVPVPSIKPGEVLVQVEAAGINPSDLGSVQGRFPHAVLPRIVGRDFAGTVVEGPAELIGKKVWGTGGDLGIDRDGTHAEYLAVPQSAISLRPANLSAEAAATVGVPFITAFSALVTLGEIKKGEWVIVSGAAGAVGQAAVQIAHARGARVIALLKNAKEGDASGFPAPKRSQPQTREIWRAWCAKRPVGAAPISHSMAWGRVFSARLWRPLRSEDGRLFTPSSAVERPRSTSWPSIATNSGFSDWTPKSLRQSNVRPS